MKDGSCPTAIVSSTWCYRDDDEGREFRWWPLYFKTDQSRNIAVMKHEELNISKCQNCPVNILYKAKKFGKALDKLKNKIKGIVTDDMPTVEDNLEMKKIKRREAAKLVYDNEGADSSNNNTSSSSSDEDNHQLPKEPNIPNLLTYNNRDDQERNIAKKKHCHSPSNSQTVLNSKPKIVQDVPNVPNFLTNNNPSNSQNVVNSQPTIIQDVLLQDCHSCLKTQGMLKDLMISMEKMKNQIKNLTQMVEQVLIQRNLEQSQVANTTVLDNYVPITSLEKLVEFNAMLEDPNVYEECSSILKLIGGKDIPDITRRMLLKMFKTNVARDMNWSGRNNKPAVKNFTNVVKLIEDTVRKNPLTNNASNQQIDIVIKLWFRGAGGRDGGRSQRNRN